MDDTVDEPSELTDPDSISAHCGHTGENMRNKILAVAVAAAGVAFSGVSMAATDGTVGATSSGTSVITLTIPSLIKVSGFTDIALGTYNGDGVARSGASAACVSRNSAGNYTVTATSTNTSFNLKSGALATTIPYSVTWGGAALTYNTALGGQVADSSTLAACTPVAGKLGVSVPAAGMDAALPGSYTDTVTITVAPI